MVTPLEIDELEWRWFNLIRYTTVSYLFGDETIARLILTKILDLLKVNQQMGFTKRLYGVGNSMSVYVSQLIRAKHDKSLRESYEKLLSQGIERKYHIILGYDSETKKGEIQPYYYKRDTFYLYCKSEYSLPSSRRLVYVDIRDITTIISLIGNTALFHRNNIISMMTEMDRYHTTGSNRPSCHCCCISSDCDDDDDDVNNDNLQMVCNIENNGMYHHK